MNLRDRAIRAGYPLVKCERTGHQPGPGYAVCGRVAKDNAPVGEVLPATKEHVGQILCAIPGHKHDKTTAQDAVLVCPSCAREKGWIA